MQFVVVINWSTEIASSDYSDLMNYQRICLQSRTILVKPMRWFMKRKCTAVLLWGLYCRNENVCLNQNFVVLSFILYYVKIAIAYAMPWLIAFAWYE